ncbi:hypothetical protein FAGAP_665 [Fusarium agapanthi]|uniref:Uncharacterized protein n=1 Tax=Fusarium agapanthi TaxID=1803897 RepID=A0A9P5BMK9_9HYPO|nr:hypothetical protein FAGAP_665 [Fusarium agapanthi]
MPKNKRRGKGGHSYRAGPYERPQDESGRRGHGRGGDRGRGRGALNANSGGLRGGYSSFQGGDHGYGGQGYGSGDDGRGSYVPYPAGDRGRGAGAGRPNFPEGPGRAAGPAFWNEQEAPSYDARENEDMAEEAQSASHEVTDVSDLSIVPHGRGFCMDNSEAGGKQENIIVDGSDESVANLNRMLPPVPIRISVVAHGTKKTLSQEELSKVKVDVNSMDRLKPEGLAPAVKGVARAIENEVFDITSTMAENKSHPSAYWKLVEPVLALGGPKST